MILILMGVSVIGKTTIGKLLSTRTGRKSTNPSPIFSAWYTGAGVDQCAGDAMETISCLSPMSMVSALPAQKSIPTTQS